jgi:DNA repair photolyase
MSAPVIYQPKGRAGEYAEWATNPYVGCGHGCVYCYVPHIPGQPDRQTFNRLAIPRPDFAVRADHAAQRLQKRGISAQVMLSFTTDPYHRFDTSLTREVLAILHDYGHGFCTLTKGGTRALRDLPLFNPHTDAFACTLTSLDDRRALKWEPQAAPSSDRLKALWSFHQAGIFTIVSLEPVLCVEDTLEIIRATAHMVNLYKVGKANYIKLPQAIDWQRFTQQVTAELRAYNAEHYIKRDLQMFLPPNYPNIQHRIQHF